MTVARIQRGWTMVALAAVVACRPAPPPPMPLVVGVVAPLSGAQGAFGQALVDGLESGLGPAGADIRLVSVDAGEPTATADAARRLIEENGARLVIGGLDGANARALARTVAAADQLGRNGSAGPLALTISGDTDTRGSLRWTPSTETQLSDLGDLLDAVLPDARHIALDHGLDRGAALLAEHVAAAVRARGGSVDIQSYPDPDETEAPATAEEDLEEARPADAVIVCDVLDALAPHMATHVARAEGRPILAIAPRSDPGLYAAEARPEGVTWTSGAAEAGASPSVASEAAEHFASTRGRSPNPWTAAGLDIGAVVVRAATAEAETGSLHAALLAARPPLGAGGALRFDHDGTARVVRQAWIDSATSTPVRVWVFGGLEPTGEPPIMVSTETVSTERAEQPAEVAEIVEVADGAEPPADGFSDTVQEPATSPTAVAPTDAEPVADDEPVADADEPTPRATPAGPPTTDGNPRAGVVVAVYDFQGGSRLARNVATNLEEEGWTVRFVPATATANLPRLGSAHLYRRNDDRDTLDAAAALAIAAGMDVRMHPWMETGQEDIRRVLENDADADFVIVLN